MSFERMLNKTRQPDAQEMLMVVGPLAGCWEQLNRFVQTTYEVQPVVHFGGAKYGWEIDYRKGGRPLCALYPEQNAFTVLIVLGAKETAQAVENLEIFHPNVRACLEDTPSFHDGRWLWIRVRGCQDVEDIEKLLVIKRKPVKK